MAEQLDLFGMQVREKKKPVRETGESVTEIKGQESVQPKQDREDKIIENEENGKEFNIIDEAFSQHNEQSDELSRDCSESNKSDKNRQTQTENVRYEMDNPVIEDGEEKEEAFPGAKIFEKSNPAKLRGCFESHSKNEEQVTQAARKRPVLDNQGMSFENVQPDAEKKSGIIENRKEKQDSDSKTSIHVTEQNSQSAQLRNRFESHKKNKQPVAQNARKRPAPFVSAAEPENTVEEQSAGNMGNREKSADNKLCLIKVLGKDITEERLLAIRQFLINNHGDIKVNFEIETELHGEEILCLMALPDELSVNDSKALEFYVETLMEEDSISAGMRM